MPLGPRLPGAYAAWRVVEGDLHDIARRMREYDPNARLIRNDQSGALGLAVQRHDHRKGLAFVREMYDLDTDRALVGCPDGRALRCLRAYDSRRVDMRDWYRRSAAAEAAAERRFEKEVDEDCGDMSEVMAYRMARDSGATNRAYIPKSTGAAT